jgi:hypothetical protein
LAFRLRFNQEKRIAVNHIPTATVLFFRLMKPVTDCWHWLGYSPPELRYAPVRVDVPQICARSADRRPTPENRYEVLP